MLLVQRHLHQMETRHRQLELSHSHTSLFYRESLIFVMIEVLDTKSTSTQWSSYFEIARRRLEAGNLNLAWKFA